MNKKDRNEDDDTFINESSKISIMKISNQYIKPNIFRTNKLNYLYIGGKKLGQQTQVSISIIFLFSLDISIITNKEAIEL